MRPGRRCSAGQTLTVCRRGWGLGCGGRVHTRRQPLDHQAQDVCFICLRAGHTHAFSSAGAGVPAGRPQWSGPWPHSRSGLQAPCHGGPGTRLRQPCKESPVAGCACPGSALPALSGVLPSGLQAWKEPPRLCTRGFLPWPWAQTRSRERLPSAHEGSLCSLCGSDSPSETSWRASTLRCGLVGPAQQRGQQACGWPRPGGTHRHLPLPGALGRPELSRAWGSARRVKAGSRGQPGTTTTPFHPQARAIGPHPALCRLATLPPTGYSPQTTATALPRIGPPPQPPRRQNKDTPEARARLDPASLTWCPPARPCPARAPPEPGVGGRPRVPCVQS